MMVDASLKIKEWSTHPAVAATHPTWGDDQVMAFARSMFRQRAGAALFRAVGSATIKAAQQIVPRHNWTHGLKTTHDYRPLKMKQQWQIYAEWTAARVVGHHHSDV